MVKTLRMPILWPVRLSARTRDFHSLKRSSILLRATGSNLEVIKTQGVLKNYRVVSPHPDKMLKE